MQHNATQPVGTVKDIFYHGVNNNQFEMWELRDTNAAVELAVTINIVEVGTELYKQEVTLPEYNCIVFIKFNGHTMFIRVGDPGVEMVSYSGNDVAISYERVNSYGSVLETGNMVYRGNGIHSYVPSDAQHSVIRIGDSSYSLDVPYDQITTEVSSGTIVLQPNRWQMIAINRKDKIHDYFVSKLEQQTGTDGSDLFEVIKAFPSSDESHGKYQVFKPGVTNVLSSSNFNMVTTDSGVDEINPFLCKTKDFASAVVFDWSNE